MYFLCLLWQYYIFAADGGESNDSKTEACRSGKLRSSSKGDHSRLESTVPKQKSFWTLDDKKCMHGVTRMISDYGPEAINISEAMSDYIFSILEEINYKEPETILQKSLEVKPQFLFETQRLLDNLKGVVEISCFEEMVKVTANDLIAQLNKEETRKRIHRIYDNVFRSESYALAKAHYCGVFITKKLIEHYGNKEEKERSKFFEFISDNIVEGSNGAIHQFLVAVLYDNVQAYKRKLRKTPGYRALDCAMPPLSINDAKISNSVIMTDTELFKISEELRSLLLCLMDIFNSKE